MDLIIINKTSSETRGIYKIEDIIKRVTDICHEIKIVCLDGSGYEHLNKYGEIPLLIIVDQLEESGIISHQLDRAGCFGFIFYDAGEYHVVTSFGNHRFSTFKIEPGLLGYPQDIDEKKFCLYSLESLCLYAVQKETSLLKTSDLVRKMIKSRSFKFF